eukprot:CAMPEP_0117491306 /NCGR_PEP_ID=MMETSP0784-20121206/17998_1 /TAXON_ID=39447 /ORGANISM="" /LENGTH=820 /DNA_ID=CAMNT_0005286091 /DNA_START=90 /DNA_END=2552 /DNA_ORIENTATION=+
MPLLAAIVLVGSILVVASDAEAGQCSAEGAGPRGISLLAHRRGGLKRSAATQEASESLHAAAIDFFRASAEAARSCPLDDAAACVDDCFVKENNRLMRQHENGFWTGFLGIADSVIGAIGGDKVWGIAEGLAEFAVTTEERANELENLKADNCLQVFAGVTLRKWEQQERASRQMNEGISDVQEVLEFAVAHLHDIDSDIAEIGNDLREGFRQTAESIRNTVKATARQVYDQVTSAIDVGLATQKQIRALERRMDAKMRQAAQKLAQTQALLARKLDAVYAQVLESRRIMEENHYSTMSVTFASSIAEVTGAFQDMIDILEELHVSDEKLLTMNLTKLSLITWGIERHEVKLELRTRLSDAFQRARDGLTKAMTSVVDGNFLDKHYQVQMFSLAVEWLTEKQSCAVAMDEVDGFIDFIHDELLDKDAVLELVTVAVIQYVAIARFRTKVFGDASVFVPSMLTAASRIFEDFKQQFMDTNATIERVRSALEVALPNVCPVRAACKNAAVAQDIDIEGFVEMALTAEGQVYMQYRPSDLIGADAAAAASSKLYLCDLMPDMTGALSVTSPPSDWCGVWHAPRFESPTPHPTPASDCKEVSIGKNPYDGPVTRTDLKLSGYECPETVNKGNWNNNDNYNDEFEVVQEGPRLVVKRVGSIQSWGMLLRFSCCKVREHSVVTVTCPERYVPRFLASPTSRIGDVAVECVTWSAYGAQQAWAPVGSSFHDEGASSVNYIYPPASANFDLSFQPPWPTPLDCERGPVAVFLEACPAEGSEANRRELAKCLWSGPNPSISKAVVSAQTETWPATVDFLARAANMSGAA